MYPGRFKQEDIVSLKYQGARRTFEIKFSPAELVRARKNNFFGIRTYETILALKNGLSPKSRIARASYGNPLRMTANSKFHVIVTCSKCRNEFDQYFPVIWRKNEWKSFPNWDHVSVQCQKCNLANMTEIAAVANTYSDKTYIEALRSFHQVAARRCRYI